MTTSPGWQTYSREAWVNSIRRHVSFERWIMADHWATYRTDPIFDTYYEKHRQLLIAISIMEGLVT